MRIDGPSSRSYPIKRKPRKGAAVVDDAFEEVDSENEISPQLPAPTSRPQSTQAGPTANVPARQQDMIFPRSVSNRVAHALASYLTTASYVDWDMEVLGLDLHV
ncbi:MULTISPECIES: hypothetical protein [unclassified Pseudomonas]|uniref:hypothetical protein n=1 Tax=unclassified Pseudomonas TaxID=196821 RepID=UPI002AC9AEF2|nr:MULTISPECIES: hypothetical protein [unclassified Pseudomonas]MEB0039585.1 hypothetical protein [Pseudomonas sp. MH10]MEB0077048.1 hypothetical protein [Pseudomonas sp. MH10out]MEB0089850.1 hypothetical protein [Pseudomonas sp. CCI4.2]MEB0102730.1 hypothetical protein [Pseudomonas sp. CCI3.2]MEB0120196.1 hypothetical protein [Pseudomonas sp. CCI1.2]